MGVQVITFDEELRDEIPEFDEYFGTLRKFMLTLVQFITVDGMADIYLPLIHAKPLLLVYFPPVIMLLSIVLMNLITAVIVEGAIQSAQEHRAMRKKEIASRARQL